MIRSLALVTILFFLQPPVLTIRATQAVAQTDSTYFYSGGKRLSLWIARDRVAIRFRADTTPGTLQTLLRRDPRLRSAVPDSAVLFREQRIVIVPLQDSVSRAGLDLAVASLRSDPAVEFVGTVLLSGPTRIPIVMTDELVARFKPDIPASRIEETYRQYGLEIVRGTAERGGRVVLRVRAGGNRTSLEVANALVESGLVEFAHPNFFVRTETRSQINLPAPSTDPLFGDQWHLHNTGQGGGTPDADVDAPEAWGFTQGNHTVVIAVLDDGIQWDHPDLSPNVVPGGRDFTSNPADNDPRPGVGDNHGTAVSGVAAARGDNGVGGSGSCPGCGLLPIRMLGGAVADHADAFDHAVAQGASVITNSWGYPIGTPATDVVVDAITNAAGTGRNGLGAVIFFAMTNTEEDNCVGAAPDISSHDNVIAISRSTNLDLLGHGGFGACMELLAPTRGGTLGITTTDRTGADGYSAGDYFNDFSGTSSATPLAAGVAGLVLSINPNLTRAQVQRILELTADQIDGATAAYDANGFSSTHGYGRVNAHHAVVPSVKISVTPRQVRRNRPFNVTVTATAPYGLTSLWWFGQTGIPELDVAHMQSAGGAPVFTYTWSNVRIDAKGLFRLGANARDVRYPTPGDGYPHQASEGGGIGTTQILVTPLAGALGLALLGLSLLLSGVMALTGAQRARS